MTRLLIIGPDGCGKDTLARLVRDNSTLRYPEPTSLTWAREIPEWQDGRDIEDWWNRRREHRDEWVDAAARLLYRGGWTALAQLVFRRADIYTGLRTAEELVALTQAELVTGVIWCYNSGLRHLHGIDMTPEQSADITLESGAPWIVATPRMRGAHRVINLFTPTQGPVQ